MNSLQLLRERTANREKHMLAYARGSVCVDAYPRSGTGMRGINPTASGVYKIYQSMRWKVYRHGTHGISVHKHPLHYGYKYPDRLVNRISMARANQDHISTIQFQIRSLHRTQMSISTDCLNSLIEIKRKSPGGNVSGITIDATDLQTGSTLCCRQSSRTYCSRPLGKRDSQTGSRNQDLACLSRFLIWVS